MRTGERELALDLVPTTKTKLASATQNYPLDPQWPRIRTAYLFYGDAFLEQPIPAQRFESTT
jgi:hypothetical protein